MEADKLVDLAVLDRDDLTIPEDQIHQMQPQITVIGGKGVFVHKKFAEEYNFKSAGALVSTYKDLVTRRKPASVRGGG